MKRSPKLTEKEIYNYWLKHHNIDVDYLIAHEPELIKTPEWYDKYPVTQEQHDEWYNWVIGRIMKEKKCSRKIAVRLFTFDYLNLAPAVISDEQPSL